MYGVYQQDKVLAVASSGSGDSVGAGRAHIELFVVSVVVVVVDSLIG